MECLLCLVFRPLYSAEKGNHDPTTLALIVNLEEELSIKPNTQNASDNESSRPKRIQPNIENMINFQEVIGILYTVVVLEGNPKF